MSKARRERRLRAEERWPLLANLRLVHFNQDYAIMYGSLDGALATAVSAGSLEHRRAVLKEWRDWNATEGSVDDIRPLLDDGFSVDLFFKTALDARDFMNRVYEELLVGVKAETQHQFNIRFLPITDLGIARSQHEGRSRGIRAVAP
jgi:hypothetical protein